MNERQRCCCSRSFPEKNFMNHSLTRSRHVASFDSDDRNGPPEFRKHRQPERESGCAFMSKAGVVPGCNTGWFLMRSGTRTRWSRVMASASWWMKRARIICRAVSYTHLRAHETPEHLVCRLLLEKK